MKFDFTIFFKKQTCLRFGAKLQKGGKTFEVFLTAIQLLLLLSFIIYYPNRAEEFGQNCVRSAATSVDKSENSP